MFYYVCTMIYGPSTKQPGPKLPSDFCRKLLALSSSERVLKLDNSLGLGVLGDFNKLRIDTQLKNIAAWTPVVAEILQGFVRFDDKAVSVV